jgi:hypothetical protein
VIAWPKEPQIPATKSRINRSRIDISPLSTAALA